LAALLRALTRMLQRLVEPEHGVAAVVVRIVEEPVVDAANRRETLHRRRSPYAMIMSYTRSKALRRLAGSSWRLSTRRGRER
jgi:hypothetical protein